jgi:hypothetical protein
MNRRKLHRNLDIGHATPPRAAPDEVAHVCHPGTTNDNQRLTLDEAIIRAAELIGSDGKGKGGLVGYCLFVAHRHRAVFNRWLGKMLDSEIKGTSGNAPVKTDVDSTGAREEFRRRIEGMADRQRQHKEHVLQQLTPQERLVVEKFFAMLDGPAAPPTDPPTPLTPKAGSRS